MKSACSKKFWKLYTVLPTDIRKLAKKNYLLWRRNPGGSGLNFEKLEGNRNNWSVRVGVHYRAVCSERDGTYLWIWIGTKEEFKSNF